jgi:nucleotide-binding universal stress UspA family protein
MSVVVGHQPTPEGRAALREAAREARLRALPLVAVDATRHGNAPLPADLLAGLPVEVRPVEVVLPDPADRVLRAAQETGADLIVVGTRHRTAVGKFVLGSTTQRVLLEAPCPVLVVKSEA